MHIPTVIFVRTALGQANRSYLRTMTDVTDYVKPNELKTLSLTEVVRSASADLPHGLARELVAFGLVACDAVWQLLPGGRTNQVWHVSDNGLHRVVKLYANDAETPLFRNDPLAEALVLQVLINSGLSPRPVYSGVLSVGAVLIYEHQPGSPWRTGAKHVAMRLKMLHGMPYTDQLAVLPLAPDGSAALVDQTMTMLMQIPADLVDPILAIPPRGDVPPAGRRVLLHGDPVPDNLICPPNTSGESPVFVDWQCPALGDPVMDLALFLSPAMQQIGRGRPLSDQERDSFLTAYDDCAATSRLTSLKPFLHWRIAVYCLWKTTRDTPDLAYAPALEVELEAFGRSIG